MRAFAVIAALVVQTAWAQAPNVIGYHGRLLAADGSPVTGSASMTFSFYDALTGGAPLWTETQTVALTDGFYATYLGNVTALPADLFRGAERYLEISVNGTALQPRLRAGSVPYALHTSNARNVQGGTVNAQSVSVNSVEVIDSQGNLVGPASAVTQVTATTPLLSSGGKTPTLSVAACAAGEVLKSDGTSWACASDAIGTTGSVVRSVTAGDGISVTGDSDAPVISVTTGTGPTEVVRGDDDRLSPAGSVTAYLGATAPAGWVMANGGTASRTTCAALFAVIGTTFGTGDGTTTFGLPNLNDRRFLMGRSAAESLGATGGSFDHSHSVAAHDHTMAHSHNMNHNHGMDHVHGMSHSHAVDAHVHGTGGNVVTGNGGSTYNSRCTVAASGGANCGSHTHGVTGATDPSAPNTGGPSVGTTAGASATATGAPSTANTGGSSATNTGSGGPTTTGSSNPPYFAVNYIIKC